MKEEISLEIANYWTSNDFLTETNKCCGSLIAFDWIYVDGKSIWWRYLTEINTNVDLSYLEVENFKFDVFVEFLKKNNFTFVLGLRNVATAVPRARGRDRTDANAKARQNPSPEWTDKLKEILKSNEIDYDEYVVNIWPSEIPEFDIPDYVFILRYSYDVNSKIDQLAAWPSLFIDFIKNSDWEKYYDEFVMEMVQNLPESMVEKNVRVIVLCSDIENLVLKDKFVK